MVSSKDNNVSSIISKAPDFIKDTPLDCFFDKLDKSFLSKIATLDTKINETKDFSLYTELGYKDNEHFVKYLLSAVSELHLLIQTNVSLIKENDSNLLPISLHDMKYLDQLLNLLIIHGIDANLLKGIRIPLESKSLSNFRKQEKRYEVPRSHSPDSNTLVLVVGQIKEIMFSKHKDDYLKSIFIKGQIYSNVFLAQLALYIKDPSPVNDQLLTDLENLQETYHLYSMYSLFAQLVTDTQARTKILTSLSVLPIRRADGVISLVDFIIGVREDEHADIEKINRVSQVLLSKPKTISNSIYLGQLFAQIYDCLSYVNRPLLITCLNNVIVEFFKRNKRIVKDFLFNKIYSILFNRPRAEHSAKSLNDMINVLISLSKNPLSELVNELISGDNKYEFFMHLWVYCLFLKKNQKLDPLIANKNKTEDNSPYFEVVLSLIQSFIIVSGDYSVLNYLSLSILNFDHEKWEYRIDLETQLAYIIPKNEIKAEFLVNGENNKAKKVSQMFDDIDLAVDLFTNLLKLINNQDEVKNVFLEILSRWVKNTTKGTIKCVTNEEITNGMLILIDLKILERINREFRSELIKKPNDILNLIDELVLFIGNENVGNDQVEIDSDDEEEEGKEESESENVDFNNTTSLQIILELFELIITQSPPKVLKENHDLIRSIDNKLIDFKHKLKNYEMVHNQVEQVLHSLSVEVDLSKLDMEDNDVDQATLDRALINVCDPLVPVKVNGLADLRMLIEKKSKVISFDQVLRIYMQYLKQSDPFVYLNVIKGLTKFCELETESTLSALLEFYDNKRKRNKLDDILKVGEVFVGYVQHENELFEGKFANQLIDLLLSKLREHDTLDNRIRMSSMSILGSCLQVNAAGIQSRIQEILDCVFGILQFETQSQAKIKDDSFLMRRSAIHLLHDLMYNSGLSLLPEQYNVTKLKILLEYVRTTESDYLVCEQIDKLLMVLAELTSNSIELDEID